MANGSVWVSPGTLETKVMVAPNSPSDRAKPSIMPVRMPGKLSGKADRIIRVQNTRTPIIQEVHMAIGHLLADIVEDLIDA